jgi:hypothetical protein
VHSESTTGEAGLARKRPSTLRQSNDPSRAPHSSGPSLEPTLDLSLSLCLDLDRCRCLDLDRCRCLDLDRCL